jgi:hypothetical protein
VFRVLRSPAPGVSEVAARSGARLRWTPQRGPVASDVELHGSGFPRGRRVRIRFGGIKARGGSVGRRGRFERRLEVPRLSSGAHRVTVAAGRAALRFSFTISAGFGIRALLESVPAATGHRYGARDNLGNTLDTLKVIPDPGGGYLGVYHTLVGGVFVTKLATSTDLLAWRHRADLDAHASQPTIAALADGSFVVAYEKDSGCTGRGAGGNCLRFLHYPSRSALLAGEAERSFQAARTLSNCAEGTPNIYSARLEPDIASSEIDVGFHYFRGCDVDRQARGTLTDFSSFSARVEPQLNAAFEAFGPGGNIGDRDSLDWEGKTYNLHEVQFTKGDFGSWRTLLYQWGAGAQRLSIRTHKGSTAFANPTFTSLRSPSGREALLVTIFLPHQGAPVGEGGELVYYRVL